MLFSSRLKTKICVGINTVSLPRGGLQSPFELQKQRSKEKQAQNVWKKHWTPPIFSNPISSSFFFYVNLKSYGYSSGTLWTPKATKQCPKNLSSKSQIVLMNPSSNVKPPSFEHMYLPHLKKTIFMVMGAWSGGLYFLF